MARHLLHRTVSRECTFDDAAGMDRMRVHLRGKNCWEFQGCGRGPDCECACPAATAEELDGVNGGQNAGRACWVVTDTLCEGRLSGPYERKITVCRKCGFYHRVAVEAGTEYVDDAMLLERYRASEAGRR